MKIRIGLILFFSVIGPFSAYADAGRDLIIQEELDYFENHQSIEPLTPQAPTTAFHDRVNTFSIEAQTFYNHYNEPQKTRKVTGVWNGVEGKYIFRPRQGNIFNNPFFNYYDLEGLYAAGKNHLEENLSRFSSDDTITKQFIKYIPGYMFENRVLLGRDFIPFPSLLRLTPYMGFGIRYKTVHASGRIVILDDTSEYLNDDHSEIYYYLPIGLTLDLAARQDYEISLNLEYDYLLKGYEKIDYANYDEFAIPQGVYPNSNVRFSQGHGWGGRSSLKFLKHFSLADIYFEPYVRYWHMGTSKEASGFILGTNTITTVRKNYTLEAGTELGVQF